MNIWRHVIAATDYEDGNPPKFVGPFLGWTLSNSHHAVFGIAHRMPRGFWE